MPDYRLYHFERGHIERAELLAAVDDVRAELKATAKVDGRMAELWRGSRRIRTFDAVDRPRPKRGRSQ